MNTVLVRYVTIFVQNDMKKPKRKTRSECRDIDENQIVQRLGETCGIIRRLATNDVEYLFMTSQGTWLVSNKR